MGQSLYKKLLFGLCVTIVLLGGGAVFTHTPVADAAGRIDFLLAPLPGLDAGTNPGLKEYIQTIFRLGIGIAIISAVLMIALGGAIKSFSAVVSQKDAGNQFFWDAILGLLLAFSVIIIINVINPDLANLDFALDRRP